MSAIKLPPVSLLLRPDFFHRLFAKTPGLEQPVDHLVFLFRSKFPTGKDYFCTGFFDALAELAALVVRRVAGNSPVRLLTLIGSEISGQQQRRVGISAIFYHRHGGVKIGAA